MLWHGQTLFSKVLIAQSQREHLKSISQYLQQAVVQKGYDSPSTSHIIPVIVGESQAAIDKAKYVQESGFYAMPVRPPTVPKTVHVCVFL